MEQGHIGPRYFSLVRMLLAADAKQLQNCDSLVTQGGVSVRIYSLTGRSSYRPL